MKKFICSTIIMIAVILAISISAYANTDNSYSNGTDMYSDGVVEFYSNIDDEDKLYKINLSDMTEEKVLNEHIISMVNKDQYLYLLTYADEKSNLLKFNVQDNSVFLEKGFDSFVTNIALRDSVLYYVEEQNIFTYNLQTKENSIFIENENVDFIYFTDRNTLKYLVKNGSNYDTKIYDFNAVVIEQNEVSLFSLRDANEISLMSVSSYSPRLSAPSTTNSYYIHTSYGGLNECIHISGGSVLPNCVGYAWGRSYENLGSRPNLSKANAEYWYGTNDGYSRGKTPCLGAVACWRKGIVGDDPNISGSDAGHVAVVEQIDGDVVITSESGYGSSRWWKTTRSASNSNFSASSSYIFQGFIYVCGKNSSANTEPPSNAILSINKENFLLGETFTLTCEADSYCEYYMSIIDVDSGQVVDSGGISGTYSNSFQRAGHYTAYVTAYNSQGSINSNWVDFYFFGAPPTVANLSVNKSKLCLGESIEFNTYTNAYYSKIYMTIMSEKGDVVYSGNIPYQFEYIPSEGGVYYTHITAYTHEGGVDSNHISFEVYDSAAINPKITSNKTVISTGENIIFNFEADFATNYVLGIDKKGYGRISTPNVGTDSSYTTSFLETGIYSVYATCYNELGGCDSSKIEFIVIDEKSTFCIQNSDSVRIIKKINGNSNNYSCIIALYQNRKLVKYLNKPNLNGTTILDETILCSDEYDEIKVMVWNGLSTLKPLCDAEVIPYTEFIIE